MMMMMKSKYGFPSIVLHDDVKTKKSPVTLFRAKFEDWIKQQLLVTATDVVPDLFEKWENDSEAIISSLFISSNEDSSAPSVATATANFSQLVEALRSNRCCAPQNSTSSSYTAETPTGITEAALFRIARPDRLEFSKEIMKVVAANIIAGTKAKSTATLDSIVSADATTIAKNAARYFAQEITNRLAEIFSLATPGCFITNNENFQKAPPLHDEYYGKLNFTLHWIEVVTFDAAHLFATSPTFHDAFSEATRSAYQVTFRNILKEYVEFVVSTLTNSNNSSSSIQQLNNRIVYCHFVLLRLRRLATIIASMSSRSRGTASANTNTNNNNNNNNNNNSCYNNNYNTGRNAAATTTTTTTNDLDAMLLNLHQDPADAADGTNNTSNASSPDLTKMTNDVTMLVRKVVHFCGVDYREISSSSVDAHEAKLKFDLLKFWHQESLRIENLLAPSNFVAGEAIFPKASPTPSSLSSSSSSIQYEKSFNSAQVGEKQSEIAQFFKNMAIELKHQKEQVHIKRLQVLIDKLVVISSTVPTTSQDSAVAPVTTSSGQVPLDQVVAEIVDSIVESMEEVLILQKQQQHPSSSNDAIRRLRGINTLVRNWISKQQEILAAPVTYFASPQQTISYVQSKLLMRYFRENVVAAAVDRSFDAVIKMKESTSSCVSISGTQALALVGTLYRADSLPEKVLQALSAAIPPSINKDGSESFPIEKCLTLAWNLVRDVLIKSLALANPNQQQQQQPESSGNIVYSSSSCSSSSSTTAQATIPLATFLERAEDKPREAQVTSFGAALLMLAYNLTISDSENQTTSAASSATALAWDALCIFFSLPSSSSCSSATSPASRRAVLDIILQFAHSSFRPCKAVAAIVLSTVTSPLILPPHHQNHQEHRKNNKRDGKALPFPSQPTTNAYFAGMFRNRPLYCPLLEEVTWHLGTSLTSLFTSEAEARQRISSTSSSSSSSLTTSPALEALPAAVVPSASLLATVSVQLSGRVFPIFFFTPYDAGFASEFQQYVSSPTTSSAMNGGNNESLSAVFAKDKDKDKEKERRESANRVIKNLAKYVDDFWLGLINHSAQQQQQLSSSSSSSFVSLVVKSAKHVATRMDFLFGDIDLQGRGKSNPESRSYSKEVAPPSSYGSSLHGHRFGRGHAPAGPPPSSSAASSSEVDYASYFEQNGRFCSLQDSTNLFFSKSLMMLAWLLRYDVRDQNFATVSATITSIVQRVKKNLFCSNNTNNNNNNNNKDQAKESEFVADRSNNNNSKNSSSSEMLINNSTSILIPLQLISSLLDNDGDENEVQADGSFLFKKPPYQNGSASDGSSPSSSSSSLSKIVSVITAPWTLFATSPALRSSYSFADASNPSNEALVECVRGESPLRPHANLEIVKRLLQQFLQNANACQAELTATNGRPPGASNDAAAATTAASALSYSNPLSAFETILVRSLVGHFLYSECRPVAKAAAENPSSVPSGSAESPTIGDKIKQLFSPENINTIDNVQRAKIKKEKLVQEQMVLIAKLESATKVDQDGTSNATDVAAERGDTDGHQQQQQQQQQQHQEAKSASTISDSALSPDERAKLQSKLDRISQELQTVSRLASAVAMKPSEFGQAFARSLLAFVVSGNPLEAAAFLEQMLMNADVAASIFSSTSSILTSPIALLTEILRKQLADESVAVSSMQFLSPIELYNLAVFLRIVHQKIVFRLVALPTRSNQDSAAAVNPPPSSSSSSSRLTQSKQQQSFLFQTLYSRKKTDIAAYPSEVIQSLAAATWQLFRKFAEQRLKPSPYIKTRGDGFDCINSYEAGSLFFLRHAIASCFRFTDVLGEVRKFGLVGTEREALRLFSRELDIFSFATKTDSAEKVVFGGERLQNANAKTFAELMNTTQLKRGSLEEFVNIRHSMAVLARPPTNAVVKGAPYQDALDLAKYQLDRVVADEIYEEGERKHREEREEKKRLQAQQQQQQQQQVASSSGSRRGQVAAASTEHETGSSKKTSDRHRDRNAESDRGRARRGGDGGEEEEHEDRSERKRRDRHGERDEHNHRHGARTAPARDERKSKNNKNINDNADVVVASVSENSPRRSRRHAADHDHNDDVVGVAPRSRGDRRRHHDDIRDADAGGDHRRGAGGRGEKDQQLQQQHQQRTTSSRHHQDKDTTNDNNNNNNFSRRQQQEQETSRRHHRGRNEENIHDSKSQQQHHLQSRRRSRSPDDNNFRRHDYNSRDDRQRGGRDRDRDQQHGGRGSFNSGGGDGGGGGRRRRH